MKTPNSKKICFEYFLMEITKSEEKYQVFLIFLKVND